MSTRKTLWMVSCTSMGVAFILNSVINISESSLSIPLSLARGLHVSDIIGEFLNLSFEKVVVVLQLLAPVFESLKLLLQPQNLVEKAFSLGVPLFALSLTILFALHY